MITFTVVLFPFEIFSYHVFSCTLDIYIIIKKRKRRKKKEKKNEERNKLFYRLINQIFFLFFFYHHIFITYLTPYLVHDHFHCCTFPFEIFSYHIFSCTFDIYIIIKKEKEKEERIIIKKEKEKEDRKEKHI